MSVHGTMICHFKVYSGFIALPTQSYCKFPRPDLPLPLPSNVCIQVTHIGSTGISDEALSHPAMLAPLLEGVGNYNQSWGGCDHDHIYLSESMYKPGTEASPWRFQCWGGFRPSLAALAVMSASQYLPTAARDTTCRSMIKETSKSA